MLFGGYFCLLGLGVAWECVHNLIHRAHAVALIVGSALVSALMRVSIAGRIMLEVLINGWVKYL